MWAYFGEFQPKSKRGAMLSCLATFWMVGNVTVAGNAHLNEYLVNTASDCNIFATKFEQQFF